MGYAEAAAAYRETMPSLSSDEEAGGGTADKEGQDVSQDITLSALQSAIELVSGVARDDAQAPQLRIHQRTLTSVSSLRMRRKV